MNKKLNPDNVKDFLQNHNIEILVEYPYGVMWVRCPFIGHTADYQRPDDGMYIKVMPGQWRKYECKDCNSRGKLSHLIEYLDSTDRNDWKPL